MYFPGLGMELLKIQFQLIKFYFIIWPKFFLKKAWDHSRKFLQARTPCWESGRRHTEWGGSGGQNLGMHLYIDAGKARTSEDWYYTWLISGRVLNPAIREDTSYSVGTWMRRPWSWLTGDGWARPGGDQASWGTLGSHSRGCFSASPRCHGIFTTVKAHWFLLATCQLCLQKSITILYRTFSSVRFWSFLQLRWRAHLPSVCFLLARPQEGCLSSVTYASMIPLQMLQNYLRLVGGPARWSLTLLVPVRISWLLSFTLRAVWAPPSPVIWAHDLSRAPSLENCWYLAWKLLGPRDCM